MQGCSRLGQGYKGMLTMAHKEKTVQPGKPTVEEKQAETIDELIRLIGLVKISYDWMLVDIKTRADKLYGGGNYSPELQAAIVTKEAIDLI